MITLFSLWLYKIKMWADAIWCFACLFCVPVATVAALSVVFPSSHRGISQGESSSRESVSADSSPSQLSSSNGRSVLPLYNVALYDKTGHLVQTFPDQVPTRLNGSLLVEIPTNIPDGEYQLQIQTAHKNSTENQRSIPIKIGGLGD